MSEQQSLEPITNPITFMEIFREVMNNPDVPVEKVQALYGMQRQMEQDKAEREFDAALIDAQAHVQALKWDKINAEKNSRNVSYAKIDKMLRPIRIKYHFTQSWDTEAGPTPDTAMLCCDLIHVGGHKRRYRTPMPIDGQGPKGGGVMTKPQAVNSGTSYGMRNLAKMIWNIPMLVDKEDIDGNEPRVLVSKEQIKALKKLADDVEADIPALVRYMLKLDENTADDECTLDKLPASFYDTAVKALERKREVLKKAK